MTIKQTDLKLLWSRSGNRCANCRTEITQDANCIDLKYVIGEQAHIVGRAQSAARGNSSLPEDSRDSYHNLIILCPNCHTAVDKNINDWPMERLFILKSEHELWVKQTLGEKEDDATLANQLAITTIIDSAVEKCNLENWETVSSKALAVEPCWDKNLIENIEEFRLKVLKAIWTEEFDDLKRAIQTFSILIKASADMFLENARYDINNKGRFEPIKFHKEQGWNENYDIDSIKYSEWIDDCHLLFKEASKALNWLADIVRRDINPFFFIEQGKFTIVNGVDTISPYIYVPEYEKSETQKLPSSIDELNKLLKKPFYG